MDVIYITTIILIIIVSWTEISRRNKEIEKWKNNWEFCKKLLDETRSILTEKERKILAKRSQAAPHKH